MHYPEMTSRPHHQFVQVKNAFEFFSKKETEFFLEVTKEKKITSILDSKQMEANNCESAMETPAKSQFYFVKILEISFFCEKLQ